MTEFVLNSAASSVPPQASLLSDFAVAGAWIKKWLLLDEVD